MSRLLLPLVFLTMCLSLPPAFAGDGQVETTPNPHLNDLHIGTVEYGAKIELADLQGKVVMHAIWGG